MTIANIWEAVVSPFYFFSNYFLFILLQLLSMNFVSAYNNQEPGLGLQSLKILESLLLIICFLNYCCPIFSMTTWKWSPQDQEND